MHTKKVQTGYKEAKRRSTSLKVKLLIPVRPHYLRVDWDGEANEGQIGKALGRA
jgi:hypothetical protein